MKTELFIQLEVPGSPVTYEWKQVELLERTSIPLNFNIADIQDFTKKNSSYSKTITLPGTKANNDLFKHLYNIGTYDSFEMGKSYPCYILEDTQLIFEGFFELTACTREGYDKIIGYEALVYSDTAELVNLVGDKLLRGNEDPTDDLDFSAYDHTLNYTNVIASFTATPGSGYTYIPIDKTGHWYKDVQQASSWKLDELTPSLFIKEIWDKILEDAGFTYTSTFLNSATFKRLIYPHTDRWLYYDDTTIAADKSDIGGETTLTVKARIADSDYDEWGIATYKGNATYSTQGSNSCFSHTTGLYTAHESGWYSLKTGANWRIGWTAQSVYGLKATAGKIIARVNMYKRVGSTDTLIANIYNKEVGVGNQVFYNNVVFEEFVNSTESEVFLNAGESLYCTLYLYVKTRDDFGAYVWQDYSNGTPVDVDFTFYPYEYPAGSVTEFLFELDPKITDNCTVPMTSVLHKVKQMDFLNSIIKMFNLYIEPISERKFRIEPRENYYALSSSSIDWTNKVDTDKLISIFTDNTYRGSNIQLRYKEDIDLFNTTYKDATGKQYGEYTKPATDPTNTNKYEIELIFSPTPGGDICAGHTGQIPKIFYVGDDGVIDESKTFNPRILYWKGQTAFKTGSNNTWFTYDNAGTLQPFPMYHYPYAGHFDNVYGADTLDLNFGACEWYWYDLAGTWATWNNLTNRYYGTLFAELNDNNSKIVTMYAVLNKKDVQELNFYNPIFIDGIYYKLNKITDYIPDELCKIELFKSNYMSLDFTVKYPRPVWVKPIGFVRPAANTYIDLFDGTQNAIFNANTLLNVELFDANEPLTWDTARGTKTDYFVDVVNADITRPALTVNFMRAGVSASRFAF